MSRLLSIALLCFSLSLSSAMGADRIKVKSGESIAFLGDSITQHGWDHPYGYVHLVMQGLAAQGIKTIPIPAGVSGDTSVRMLARLDGVLRKRPTWMTLSCGFNDVSPYCAWPVDLADFKKSVTEILDRSRDAGVKVVILTPTLLRDDPDPASAFNRKQLPYVEFLRQMAAERDLLLADLNKVHRAEVMRLRQASAPYGLQSDGIHMNPHGDQMLAAGVLKAFGLTDEQIVAARETWLDNVYRRETRDWHNMTVRQLGNVEAFAAREKVPLNEAIVLLWERALVKAARDRREKPDLQAIRAAARIQFGKDLNALPNVDLTIEALR